MPLKEITAALITSVTLTSKAAQGTAAHAIKQTYWQAICDIGADASKLATIALSNVRAPAILAQADVNKLLRAIIFNEGNTTSPETKA